MPPPPTDGRIMNDVKLQIGSQEYVWDILLADIDECFLLGSDFVHEHGCIIDLQSSMLHIHQQKIPLKLEITGSRSSNNISLTHDVSIPPWSGVVVTCNNAGITGEMVAVEGLVNTT